MLSISIEIQVVFYIIDIYICSLILFIYFENENHLSLQGIGM